MSNLENSEAVIGVCFEQIPITASFGDLQAINVGEQLMTIYSGVQEISSYVENTAKPEVKTYGESVVETYMTDILEPNMENYVYQVQAAVLTATSKADIATQKASEASNSATTAQTQADTATSKAGIATQKASEASNSATTAQTQADIATSKADIATQKASEASISATSAQTQADTAITQAGIATQKASEASASATSAQTQADTATSKAGIATQKANEASNSATSAQTQADTAITQAGIATQKASEASISATSAQTQADTATTQATIATQKASEASISATSAQTQADTATTQATIATQKASEASASATSAADSATAAAQLASSVGSVISDVNALNTTVSQQAGQISDLQNLKADVSNTVTTDTEQTITGRKTFIGSESDGCSTFYNNTGIERDGSPTSDYTIAYIPMQANGNTVGQFLTRVGPIRNYASLSSNRRDIWADIGVFVDDDGNKWGTAPASDIINSILTTTGISKSSNGYVKLGNGIIIQWGTIDNGSSSKDWVKTHTFEIPFTGNNYSVVASSTRTNGDAVYRDVFCNITNKTATYFTAGIYNSSLYGNGYQYITWLAVGY